MRAHRANPRAEGALAAILAIALGDGEEAEDARQYLATRGLRVTVNAAGGWRSASMPQVQSRGPAVVIQFAPRQPGLSAPQS